MESLNQLFVMQKDLIDKLFKAESNFKKTSKERMKLPYIETKLEKIEEYWMDFKKGHKNIIVQVNDEDKESKPYFTEDWYEVFEDKYISYKSLIKENLYKIRATTPETREVSALSHSGSSFEAKLPTIHLPSFSGNYKDWQTFYDMFVSLIISNKTLSPVQKLHYLKSSLSGEPETLIKNFPTTDANFSEAWEQLIKRYNNKRYNCNSILQTLFAQKQIISESANAIKQLLDITASCLKSLNNIGISTDTWDAIIVHFVVAKLPQESRQQWEYHLSMKSDDLPTWLQLTEFLESRFRTIEMIEGAKYMRTNQQVVKPALKAKSFHSGIQEVQTERKNTDVTCSFCDGSHYLYNCKQFGLKSVQERHDFVTNNRLCFNCLAPNHSVKKCRQSTNCRKCGKRHHSLIHTVYKREIDNNLVNQETTKKINVTQQHTTQELQGQGTQTAHIVANYSRGDTQSYNVLLATAVIKARSQNGLNYIVRALLDQGSQASFVTEATVQLLGLERVPINGWVSGLGDGHTKIKYMVSIHIESRHTPYHSLQVNAYVLSSLTSMLPTCNLYSPRWAELESKPLADPHFTTSGKIDLLLGAEVYSEILLNEVIKYPQGNLIAQNTILGWVISGKLAQESLVEERISSLHIHITQEEELLKQFWEFENEPNIIQKKLTQDEIKCEEFYELTTTRNEEGRFIVKLPFNTEDPECQYGNTLDAAIKRFNYLEKKLHKNPKFHAEYRKVIEEYITLNHMKLVDREDIDNPRAVYLPHHAVVREEKQTTKVRVVFDASCKGSNNVSLNDNFLIGPKLQQDLRHLLMRWRTHKICIIADLVKMYRQVRVAEDDTNFQRILWRDHRNEPIQHYKLLTLTFGTACAPYLAVKTLQKLAEEEQEKYPMAAEITKKDYYIDDLMTGCEKESEAILIFEELNSLMKSGGFELQKWSSNNKTLLNYISEKYHREDNSVIIKSDNMTKVIGICWNRKTDNFEYTINLPEIQKIITKRQVLSDIARLYDPLGWIAPVVIVAKLFIQRLWKSGLGWDDEIRDELLTEWIKFRGELGQIKNIIVPRWLHTSSESQIELHAFSDASRSAYAAVVYLRVTDEHKNITVSLISAKTKVAPIEKEMSIPRLELSGAALAAKLLSEISQVMGISKNNLYAYTDSTVVLAWLKGPASRWTTFVSNRVSEILTIMNYEQWGHVTTDFNPADCASRGLKLAHLINHDLWWSGPTWLTETIVKRNLPNLEETLEEKRIVKTLTAVNKLQEELPWERFSSLTRMLKVLSYCRRWVFVYKTPKSERLQSNFVSSEEMEHTLHNCIKKVQEIDFGSEIQLVKTQGHVQKKSVLHTLCPILDEIGLLRVGGRISLSNVTYDNKHPIIMPAKNYLTKLLITDAHQKTLHGGPQLMLNYLRGKYWIVRARDQVKKHYRECVTCLKHSKSRSRQLMGQIPVVRLKPSKPFISTGVDYAGPINIRFSPGRGAKSYKGYVCLFVCMVTRAIHLEAVTDLTAKGFIAAFRRFTSRRGHCRDLYSDNGTNFVGANKILNDMFNAAKSEIPNEIAKILTLESTTWHFIPPHAPNFGGLWEAGVRSVKTHLRKVIGEVTLTYEEIATVLTQVEACLNSRPISILSNNPEDPLPLTPGHFLVGEPIINIADRDFSNINIVGLDRWKLTQKIVNSFWKRWSKEYLLTLSQRYKWNKTICEPELNDVVVIRDENIPPAKWMLGIVVHKYPGPDNVTRVVTIKCKSGLLKRPVNKICVLTK